MQDRKKGIKYKHILNKRYICAEIHKYRLIKLRKRSAFGVPRCNLPISIVFSKRDWFPKFGSYNVKKLTTPKYNYNMIELHEIMQYFLCVGATQSMFLTLYTSGLLFFAFQAQGATIYAVCIFLFLLCHMTFGLLFMLVLFHAYIIQIQFS